MSDYTDSQQYRYDAFISYSHLDMKAAVALQRRMERYRIPKEMRARRGKESAGLKIFRDETDLPAGSLTNEVYEALKLSKKLIVICSSRNAGEGEEKYKWVSQEVQYFIDAGRCDDILPLSLDGDWDAMPANLKMVREEQFVTDVSRLKWRTATLKLLAGVLGTDFDALVRRDERRRRIKRGALMACCSVLFALCVYYFCPHTVYYADYTIRYGKPEGIGRLTSKERAARSESFAITTKHSTHEIRLEHVNSAGLVSMDASENRLDQIAVAVYDCLGNGQINMVTYLDETGRQLYTHSYAPDLSYLDIIKSKDDARWLTLPVEDGADMGGSDAGSLDSLPVRTDISRYRLELDADGYLRRRMNSVDRLPAVDETGVGGEEYEYDIYGRLREITYLDTAGNPDINKHGIAGEAFFYDNAGRISQIEYRRMDGGLMNNSKRYAMAVYQYGDVDGKDLKICYYDEKGVPVITEGGYAQEARGYDERGFLISSAYFDDAGRPVRGPYRFHKIEIAPDRMGRDADATYLDADGSPILTPEHYAKRVRRYNGQGLLEDEFYYGEDGQLNLSSEGSCHVHYEYDSNSNLEKISHYGLDGRLIYSHNGYAVMKLTYNMDGLQETESYFGVQEEPILGAEGYHMKRYVYDSRHNVHEIRLTGTMGQPTLCADGYALRILEYDSAGNIESDSYFDDYEQPTYRSGMYSKVTMEYDKRGHRIVANWLNPDGTPANDASYSLLKAQYDDIGREKQVQYYLLDRLRFMQEYEYQGSRLSARTDYLDGIQAGLRKVRRYDGSGNEVETAQYNENDLSGRSVSEFDAYGNMIRRTFYDAQNKRVSYFISEYNSYGLPIKTSYYNAEGELSREANTAEHVAVAVSEYDEHNLKIERSCYDENGSPLRINSGGKETYARLVMDYDRSGNCIKSDYYDEAGDIYQSVSQEYDIYNRELNRIYQDGEGAQLVRKEIQYDLQGNLVSTALYDRRDMLQADPESGVAKIVYVNDSYGYVIGEEFYGADGQPTAPYGTYHAYRITRENGRSVEIRYYGTDGQLALNQDGYAMETFTYDERGNETGRAFFGVEEEPILLKWRFSRYEARYDDKGNLSEGRFFDTVGREVQQVDGHLQNGLSYVKGIAKRMLIFNGNDGTSLMGDVEVKLYIPLQEFVKADDEGMGTEGMAPTDDVKSDGMLSGENPPSQEAEPVEKAEASPSEREYITVVNDYVRAIERCEGTGIMDVIEPSLLKVDAAVVEGQLDIDVSEYKLYHFYAAFYGEELSELEALLHEKYGSSIYITYEILSEAYQSAGEIAAANQAYKSLGVNVAIQKIVALDIVYTVNGTDGQGIEEGGFLSRQLVLMQVGDQWKVAKGKGFPSPPANQLVKLLTGR